MSDCEEGATHVPLAQHPLGHVFGSHAQVPVVVSQRPSVHVAQAAPLLPQDDADCDAKASHVPVNPPLQQPCGQETELHTQLPEPSQV